MFTSCGVLGASSCARPRRSNLDLWSYGSHLTQLTNFKPSTRLGQKLVQGVGFEPTKAEPTDLQSAVFDHFTNPASERSYWSTRPTTPLKTPHIDHLTSGSLVNISCLATH